MLTRWAWMVTQLKGKTSLSPCTLSPALKEADDYITQVLNNGEALTPKLVDDALDFNSSAEELGKNLGDDLAEGKPTLPLIHALQHGSPAQQETIRAAIEQGDRDQIQPILEIVRETGALDYTRSQASLESEKARAALADLPTSEFATGLANLAEFSLVRAF